MPLVKPALFTMNHIARDAGPGDILDFSENPLTVVNNNAGVTLTVAQLLAGDIDRTGTPVGGISDTLPTAEQIIQYLSGNKNLISPPSNELYGLQPNKAVETQWPANLGIIPPGSSFRRTIRNNNLGQTLTIAAGTGITISGTATIATNKWREFLFRIISSAPTRTISGTTVNGAKNLTVTNLTDIKYIQPGMSVTGTGIAAGTLVASVNQDTGVVMVDTNMTADGTFIGVTFTPTVTVQNLRAGDV